MHDGGEQAVTASRHHPARTRRPRGDDGASLVVVVVFIALASLVAVPLLTLSTTISRTTRVLHGRTDGAEAAKGALRLALADPVGLYDLCSDAGLTTGVPLAPPDLAVGVDSLCYKLGESQAEDPTQLRYGLGVLRVGATLPDPLPAGAQKTYVSGTDESAWTAVTSVQPAVDRIWLPPLPVHGLNLRSSTPLAMPAGFPACRVYFPGTYPDPLTITSGDPVYFTSGIYYFENVVTVGGGAEVVIGRGGEVGCVDDQEAAFYALNAPKTHNITGTGATFVFGAGGRLVVDNSSGPVHLVFNKRYVDPADTATAPSAGVSIETVNGAAGGGELHVPGSLRVPESMVNGSPAALQDYRASTLIAPSAAPVVEVVLSATHEVQVAIPGYVLAPQGRVTVTETAAATTQHTVGLSGGVVAAELGLSAVRPANLSFGLVNPYVQRTFKIVSRTRTNPIVTSTAIVQVNENGAYAVNSWEVQ